MATHSVEYENCYECPKFRVKREPIETRYKCLLIKKQKQWDPFRIPDWCPKRDINK